MKKHASQWRVEQLLAEIHSEWIRIAARQAGNAGSWTRRRNMPLEDIVKCTLAKKGLSSVMEIRHYFQEAQKAAQTVSKQDYLQRRKQLNPAVFKLLNRNCLRRFYEGEEAKGWRGYLVLAADGSHRTKVRRKYRTARKTGWSLGKATSGRRRGRR